MPLNHEDKRLVLDHEFTRVIYRFDPLSTTLEQRYDRFFMHHASFKGNHTIAFPGKYFNEIFYNVMPDIEKDILGANKYNIKYATEILETAYQIYLSPRAEYTYHVLDLLLQYIKNNPECLRLIYTIRFLNPHISDENSNFPRIEIDVSLGSDNAQRLLDLLRTQFLTKFDGDKYAIKSRLPYSRHVAPLLSYGQAPFDFKMHLKEDLYVMYAFTADLSLLRQTPELALTLPENVVPAKVFLPAPPVDVQVRSLLTPAIIANIQKIHQEKPTIVKFKRNAVLEHSVIFDEDDNIYALGSELLGRMAQSRIKVVQDLRSQRWLAVKITKLTAQDPLYSEQAWEREVAMTREFMNVYATVKISKRKAYMFIDASHGQKPFYNLLDGLDDPKFKTRLLINFLQTSQQVIKAVLVLHDKNIIHRMLSIRSFAERPDASCIVTDYTFALKLPKDATEIIEPGLMRSDKFFASPEILDDPQAAVYSKASDAYAIGIVLREQMLRIVDVMHAMHVHAGYVYEIINEIMNSIINLLLVGERVKRMSLTHALVLIEQIYYEVRSLEHNLQHDLLNTEKLFLAILSDNYLSVEMVLQAAPEAIAFKDHNKMSAFQLALASERYEFFDKLVFFEQKFTRLNNDFVDAVNKNESGRLRRFLTVYPGFVDLLDRQGQTPLYLACSLGNAAAVETLLSFGANVAFLTDDKQTVLHAAARIGSIEILRRMIALQIINLNAPNADGLTPLQEAILTQNRECADYLLEQGASLIAGSNYNHDIIKQALNHKQLDLAYKFYQQIHGSFEELRFLVSCCLKLDNLQCLEKIVEENQYLTDYLLNYPADPSFLLALELNNLDSAKKLVELGADVDLPNRENKHALEIALDSQQLEMAAFIYEQAQKIPAALESSYGNSLSGNGQSFLPRYTKIIEKKSTIQRFNPLRLFGMCYRCCE